ncbi:type II toxin-antitoxin system PemK/MazF family toxin [bacterium]|nr:type II toxin-antitoxin system PemK/MazF family toxin [bacterium]
MTSSDCRKGDIVLVRVDQNSNSTKDHGLRPAVIISCNVVNANMGSIIICPLVEIGQISESRVGAAYVPGELIGMSRDSLVLCLHILTMKQDQIVQRIGSLPDSLMRSVEESLEFVLDLGQS